MREAQNTRHHYNLTVQTRPYIVSSPTISKNTVNPDTRNTVWLFNDTASYFEVIPADINETALKRHLPFQVRNYNFYTAYTVSQYLSKCEAFRGIP